MKEDIEIVEYYLDQQDRKFVSEYRLRQLQAMENILTDYKRLQQENEELRRGQQALMKNN